MGNLRERLSQDLLKATRERAELRVSTIRMIRAEILNKDKEHGEEASEEDMIKVLQSMVKKREEAAEHYVRAGRAELAAKEREEIRIVHDYLPVQMSDEELYDTARAAIAELGASSVREMGKVMGLLTKRLGGRAAPAKVSQAVKELLGG